MNTYKLLQLAADLAGSSRQYKSFHLSAIALRQDGALVSSSNGIAAEQKTPSAHAEARVLRKAGKGAILWVARVLRDRKTWAMSKPCGDCQLLIKASGVKKVYYTIGPGEYGIMKLCR